MSQAIAPAVLATTVQGRNLRPGTLRDQWAGGPALLAFLRHLGCLFTREWVADLRRTVDADPAYPPVVFVHLGAVADGEAFFGKYDPTARAIADPAEGLFKAFGLGRGRLIQMLGPEVIACGLRATFKGHGQGKPIGDPWILPGLFLVEGDRILWDHRARHAGDHPDFAAIPGRAAAMAR